MTAGGTPTGSAQAGAAGPDPSLRPVPPPALQPVPLRPVDAVSAVLNRLDWALGEAGRRGHLFSWLRDPDSGDWLKVDAYYPANRVVVVAAGEQRIARAVREWVPANGLYPLLLSEQDLARDPVEVAKDLRARLSSQGWPARSDPPPNQPRMPSLPSPAARVVPAAPVALSFPDDDEVPEPPVNKSAARAPYTRYRNGPTSTDGTWLGLALVAVMVIELVLGAAIVGLNNGQYVLCLGFVLDAAARALGTVAASQRGDLDAAWTSVLFGSLVLWARPQEHATARTLDVAGPAHVTAVVAGGVLALGVLLALV